MIHDEYCINGVLLFGTSSQLINLNLVSLQVGHSSGSSQNISLALNLAATGFGKVGGGGGSLAKLQNEGWSTYQAKEVTILTNPFSVLMAGIAETRCSTIRAWSCVPAE